MILHNRNQLESQFAERLKRLSQKQSQRLKVLLGNPPDPKNVPASFWAEVERERKEELSALLILIFLLMAAQVGRRRGDALLAAELWAGGVAEDTAHRYVERSREELERKFEEVVSAETSTMPLGSTSLAPPVVSDAVAAQVAEEVFSPQRDETVAITLTTAVEAEVNEDAAQSLGYADDRDTWYTAADDRVCPICGELHGKQRPVWASKFPKGPPAHPRCRCHIAYVNEQIIRGFIMKHRDNSD